MDWAAVGYSVGDWWNVARSAALTVRGVTHRTRDNGETFGYRYLEFNSGGNVSFSALVSGTTLRVRFAQRSTTFVKVISDGGGSGNTGLKEVEAYYDPTSGDGAIVTFSLVETLVPNSAPTARVTFAAVEILVPEAAPPEPPSTGEGAVRVFGYAG